MPVGGRDRVHVSAWGTSALVVGGLVLPVAHPLLLPIVGVPSHLLWWVHVLPVALVTYRTGRKGALVVLAASVVLVAAGERLFGAGYGVPATWETAIALTVALTFTNLLVMAFALYARSVADRYRLLFEGVSLGVVNTDAAGVIRQVNPIALKLFVADGSEVCSTRVCGRRFSEVVDNPDLPRLEEIAASGGWSGWLSSGRGTARTGAHVFVAAVRTTEPEGFQVLVADRSMEVLQEQELERRGRLATLGEGLASVAHEMNNPLTTVIGHAQLGLADAPDRDETREILTVIEDQAQRMKELVGELLGFSRGTSVESTPNLAALVRRVTDVQRLTVGKRVDIETDLRFSGAVACAGAKIEQILLNLIANAGYVLAEAGGTIRVACRSDGATAEVSVEDDGPGIPEDLLHDVFSPFVSTKPEGDGTGLGLAISRRLARSMGGELMATNRDSGGARFVLTLPLEGAASPAAGPDVEPATPPLTPAG